MEPKTKRIALATLFGTMIFLSKVVVPSPIDKMFIGIQALVLALGALLLKKMGATYVAIIGGFLTSLWRVSFAPLTFGFAVLYGLFIDIFFFIFSVNTTDDNVKTSRLVVSMTVSTALVGLISYYTTVFPFGLLPRNPMLEFSILIVGALNGSVAGYFASIIWKRYLRSAIL